MPNAEFKQLIKEGIDSVANRQGKKVRAIEEEIGEALCVSYHTVQRWKRGFVPNDMERLEFIVGYCRQYGRVDRSWGQRFLTQARHPRRHPPLTGFSQAPQARPEESNTHMPWPAKR